MITHKYLKVNFMNIMEALEDARTFNHNEVYFKSGDGDIHKVNIEFISHIGISTPSIFEIKINEVDIGGTYQDFGEAYDQIRNYVE